MHQTIPVPRGCGERTPGGLYVECGVSNAQDGLPIEAFLLDPPLPVPEGADLVNKATVWQHPVTGINHLMLWIGATHYPYLPDFLEEARRYGISRKLPGTFDMSQLTPGQSRMILVHPYCRNLKWAEMTLPRYCHKHILTHMAPEVAVVLAAGGAETVKNAPGNVKALLAPRDPAEAAVQHNTGLCVFKTWELIPAEAASAIENFIEGEPPIYSRTIGSTTYVYWPTGEDASGLAPGIFGVFPLHGFALIRHDDGTVNEAAKKRLEQSGHEYYESDR